jgi:hypothetical protein
MKDECVDFGQTLTAILAMLALGCLLGAALYHDGPVKVRKFESSFGVRYPVTGDEWRIVTPVVLAKINGLEESLNEKRAARDKVRFDIAQAREFHHLSEVEDGTLKVRLNDSIKQLTQVRDTMVTACDGADDYFPDVIGPCADAYGIKTD